MTGPVCNGASLFASPGEIAADRPFGNIHVRLPEMIEVNSKETHDRLS